MVGDAPHSPLRTLQGLSPAVAPRTPGLGVGEGEPGLGHPSHVSLVLLGVEAGQVAQGEEGFALQVVGPQHVVVKHGQQQTGPLLPALLRGDQAAGAQEAGDHHVPPSRSQNSTFHAPWEATPPH